MLWDIESDPVLASTKLIAEAWDAAGLYQVGSFIGDSWKEWNGGFRNDVRSWFRGDEGAVGPLADRLLGSPAIYGHEEREAEQSVNFVACPTASPSTTWSPTTTSTTRRTARTTVTAPTTIGVGTAVWKASRIPALERLAIGRPRTC